MSFNKDLLEKLIEFNKDNRSQFTLHMDDDVFSITKPIILNSPVPVNKPTTRGGVSFSDKFAYKMNGVVDDLSVVPRLTSKMLGPSTEFGNLVITTEIKSGSDLIKLRLFTNLTNSVQTPKSIELSMIIVKIEKV